MASITGYIAGMGQVRLTLELTPQNIPTGGDILAVAILTTERNPMPLEGQLVTFWLGRDEVASERTDAHGRAAHTPTGLGFGTHAVSVQVAGIHVSQRHTFSPPPVEKLKTAKDLQVSIVGRRGDQTLLISVAGEDGMFIRSFPVSIVDGGQVFSAEMDEDGTTTHVMHIPIGESRRVEVRAGHKPELMWCGRILGPKQLR